MKLKFVLASLLALVAFAGQVAAQEPEAALDVFHGISKEQTNQQRKEALGNLNLEAIVKRQLPHGPKYIAIAQYSLSCPGLENRNVPRSQMIVVPFIYGCTGDPTVPEAEYEEWLAIATEFALRWNLLMSYFESQGKNDKPAVSLDDIKTVYRIKDDVFGKLSLESKLLMYHVLSELRKERIRNFELSNLLEENDIFEPFPSKKK